MTAISSKMTCVRSALRVVALLVAVATLLPLLSCGTDTVEKTLLVRVEPVNLPEGRVCANCPLKDLEVTVRGPDAMVAAFAAATTSYPLDCSNAVTGNNTLTIAPDSLRPPDGVLIHSVSPDFVAVQLQRQLTRQLPVEVRIEGSVPAGYTIVETAATPARAVVKGPSSAVAGLDSIFTKPLSVTDLEESFTKKIPLEIPDKVTAVSPAEGVAVEIAIAAKVETREYRDVPVSVSDSRITATVSPLSVTIRLSGPQKILDRLEREGRLKVVVDLEEAPGAGIYPRPARIALPQKVCLVTADPEIFTVTVH